MAKVFVFHVIIILILELEFTWIYLLYRYKQLDHVDWQKGRVSGTVYHGGQQFSRLLSEAYAAFSHSNPLHPDVFPSVRQMEADIVQMCLGMYGGGERACGSVTSGGKFCCCFIVLVSLYLIISV